MFGVEVKRWELVERFERGGVVVLLALSFGIPMLDCLVGVVGVAVV